MLLENSLFQLLLNPGGERPWLVANPAQFRDLLLSTVRTIRLLILNQDADPLNVAIQIELVVALMEAARQEDLKTMIPQKGSADLYGLNVSHDAARTELIRAFDTIYHYALVSAATRQPPPDYKDLLLFKISPHHAEDDAFFLLKLKLSGWTVEELENFKGMMKLDTPDDPDGWGRLLGND